MSNSSLITLQLRSLCKYIPLVAPGLVYFHDGLVEGFIMVGGNVSTGLGIILYHESPKRYMVGAKELQDGVRGEISKNVNCNYSIPFTGGRRIQSKKPIRLAQDLVDMEELGVDLREERAGIVLQEETEEGIVVREEEKSSGFLG
ncbi:hypothetical protein G5I_02095 [Acromyrmex echinatior]|uniref:Uncharacterized protein n=1 Tax=Acromyrmex echinatior TaxID=103372 RepID=F4W9E4_ACREC|nr:hypothetical protein G5I_02095 [Acromyrmex echinatior]